MKKIVALLFCLATAVAQAQYVNTPNIGLEIPANGSTSWNIPLNFNFNLIDQLLGGLNNDVINLSLKPAFGSGSPVIPCGTINQGQLYFDTANNYASYVCNVTVWNATGSGGGGGGAAFYPGAIQYALSTTTARAAVPSDVANLLSTLTGCSTANYVYSPASNSCIPSAGINAGTTGQVAYYAASGSAVSGNPATLDSSGNATFNSVTAGDGVHNGALNLPYIGTTASAPGANTFQIQPLVSVTTPWVLSPAAAPLTGLFYCTLTSVYCQQSFLSLGTGLSISGSTLNASGTGNTTSASLTANVLTKANGANSIINSQTTDDGTHPVTSPNGYGLSASGGIIMNYPNAAAGTASNKAVCKSGVTAGAVTTCSTTTTTGVQGVAVAGVGVAPGTTGSTGVCFSGRCAWTSDNATTAGDYGIPSTTVAGEIHDTGSATPTAGVDNFLIVNSVAASGLAFVELNTPDWYAAQAAAKVYALQINGTGLTAGDTVNLNHTTPATPANGINVTYSTSKSGTTDSVSGAIIGDGNAAHFLNGTGAFTSPGSGVTSVTGDGTIFSNSASTGAVTLAPATFAAHHWYGNGTGATATPGAALIGVSDTTPYSYAADTGAQNAAVVTLTPAATAYVTNLTFSFLPAYINTITNPTVNLNGLGVKTITRSGGNPISIGDVSPTNIVTVKYNGTSFDIENEGQCGVGNIPCTNTANFFSGGTQQVTTAAYSSIGAIDQGSAVPSTPTALSTAYGVVAAGGTATVALPTNNALGSGIIVDLYCGGSLASVAVSDTQGNTYTLLETVAFNGIHKIYGAFNSPAGADTVSWTPTGDYCGGLVSNYTTVAGFDVGVITSENNPSSPLSVGPITTTGADLLYASLSFGGGGPYSETLTGAYTTQNSGVTSSPTPYRLSSGYLNEPTPGSFSANWTFGGTSSGSAALIGLRAGVSQNQEADLRQFRNYFGSPLSAINATGQYVPPNSAGCPTAAPYSGTGSYSPYGALAYDTTASDYCKYTASGWVHETSTTCPAQIGQVKLASAAANITFSSISSVCTSLELVITGQTANSSQDNLYVNFNSDTTGGHYDWGIGQGGASIGAVGSGSTASSSILIGLLPPSSSGRMGSSDCIIPLYSATTFSSKAVTCGSSGYWDSSNNWHVINAGGDWNPSSAAAITSIVLTTSSSSNFPPGTTATLYGKP